MDLDVSDTRMWDDFAVVNKSKRHLTMDDDDNFSTHSAGPSKKQKKKDTDQFTGVMGEISCSMNTMARAFAERTVEPPSRQQESEDSHGIWAKLLAMKLRQLPSRQAERLKVQIDGIVLDAIDEM